MVTPTTTHRTHAIQNMFRGQPTGCIQFQFTNLSRHLCPKSAAYGTLCRAITSSRARYALHCIEFGFDVNTDTSYQFLLADRVARCISRFRVNRRELRYVSAQKFILERRLQLGNLICVRGNNGNTEPSKVRRYRVFIYRSSVKNRSSSGAQLYVPLP